MLGLFTALSPASESTSSRAEGIKWKLNKFSLFISQMVQCGARPSPPPEIDCPRA